MLLQRRCGACAGRSARRPAGGKAAVLSPPTRRALRCAVSLPVVDAATAAASSESETANQLFQQPVSAAEQLLYSLAASPDVAEAVPEFKRAGGGFLEPLTDGLEFVLKFFQSGLQQANVPYSYGFSIILLTLCIKVVTYPAIKKQQESAIATQALKPRIDIIKKRFGDDKDRITKETNQLYEEAGVDPLAGCLPTLATIPVFIGLYSSLANSSAAGLFDTEGFFWIPSLAGPTSVAARQAGSGIAWLFPFVDGAPPIGWELASVYLVLPVLLVSTMYASNAITSPPIDPQDPSANTARALQVGLPLLVGFFSLNVPSGLSLYYFTNTVLTTAITIYLKKLGGANVVMNELGPVTKPGSGRRLGVAVSAFEEWAPTSVDLNPTSDDEAGAEVDPEEAARLAAKAREEEEAAAAAAAAQPLDPASVPRRVKRASLAVMRERQERSRRVAMTSRAESKDAEENAANNGSGPAAASEVPASA